MRTRVAVLATALIPLFTFAPAFAQKSVFDPAPASAVNQKNPYEGQAAAVSAGRKLYGSYCLACHGVAGRGQGNVPPLRVGDVQKASPGAIFWFVTKGDLPNGMPAWGDVLSAQQRWRIISYIKSLGSAKAPPKGVAAERPAPSEPAAPAADPEAMRVNPAPLPKAPFLDYRLESPGNVHKITLADLPEPFATQSSSNGPRVVRRPENAWPKAPAGFKVELYASGLDNPRLIRTAPNGDAFVAEMGAGDIKVFRGISNDGKPQQVETYASGLNQPFGIAFYPPGPNPQWLYVGNTDAVVRFPYHVGDMKASGKPQHLADLPGNGRGHTTRDVQFSRDGKIMWVSVGSRSNVDDPDTNPDERLRADILAFAPDGSGMRVYASGIRNPVGLAVNPKTGQLWCSTNERDALGDFLVPDYITHVEEGGFYGWPWWYMGGHQDPRHQGKHPELKDKVITPDVILHPHNASLQLTFYDGKQFPAEYRGDIFAAEHGSWNKSVRVGYEVIRIPLHQAGKASGEYQDFLTGFVLPNGQVWGRPVGVATASDGSLLVTDDGSNSIWRVSYKGK